MKRHFYKKNLFMLLFFLLSIFTLPSTVGAAERVDTKPENLIYNGEFALSSTAAEDGEVGSSGNKILYIYDDNGNLIQEDNENQFDGAYDNSGSIPGWNYYATRPSKNYLRYSSKGHGYTWLEVSRFLMSAGGQDFIIEASPSTEPTYLFTCGSYKEDYLYQNVAAKGSTNYKFNFLRWNHAGYSKFDRIYVTIVELDSSKNVIKTTYTFPNDTRITEPALYAHNFQTAANTAYIQIRIGGDPLYTSYTADGGVDSFYLAEDGNTTAYTKVRYYAGNAENSGNGNYIRTYSFAKSSYTLSNITDAEISAITPSGYTLSGWKCVQNGQTYANGASITLPAADSNNGTVTMVAQWKKPEPVYSLTLDTHGVYPLLYSGVSSQNLAFTLSDENGKVTDNNILKNVTFTMELTDGFEKFKNTAGYAVVTLSGSKITAKKSGVVKIYAEYNGVKSTDYAVAVVPGDLNRSGSIDLDDAVQEAVILRDETKISEFGTYGKELANMNNLNNGVDVDDIVKIVAMVRGISDYYN